MIAAATLRRRPAKQVNAMFVQPPAIGPSQISRAVALGLEEAVANKRMLGLLNHTLAFLHVITLLT